MNERICCPRCTMYVDVSPRNTYARNRYTIEGNITEVIQVDCPECGAHVNCTVVYKPMETTCKVENAERTYESELVDGEWKFEQTY